jgi:hypothetical protein
MEQLINVVAVWLSLSFALPQIQGQPQIKHVSPESLVSIHYGPTMGESPDRNVMGAYDALSHTIFLRDDWNSRNPADVSVLVHELVHYLQDLASQRFECPGAREATAYAAQQRWLELYGTDLQSAFGIDAMTLKLRTACLPN